MEIQEQERNVEQDKIDIQIEPKKRGRPVGSKMKTDIIRYVVYRRHTPDSDWLKDNTTYSSYNEISNVLHITVDNVINIKKNRASRMIQNIYKIEKIA